MPHTRTTPLANISAAAIALLALFSAPALADNVVITYSDPGVFQADPTQLCAATTSCFYGTENYSDSAAQGINTTGGFVSSFTSGPNNLSGGVSFTGTYAALPGTSYGPGNQFVLTSQDQYGGSDGNPYPELFGAGNTTSSYQIALASAGVPGINYLGIWISALDPYNDLEVYDTSGNLIADFTSPSLLSALGACPGSAWCGNPTTQFAGADAGELFVYVNIFDSNADIGSLVVSDSGGTGFETSNLAVGYRNPNPPFGHDLPEPASLSVLGLGLLALGAVTLRRRGAQA